MGAFDSSDYPISEPQQLVAGDRAAWKRADLGSDYPPASHTLTYAARLEGDGTDSIAITASADGSDYVVEVASATTADWTAGDYAWQAYITRDSDSERVTVDYGAWEVVADRANATTDPRTHAKIVLDAIEAVLETRATRDQASYSIAGRSLSRMPVGELLSLRNYYAQVVAGEDAAERIRNGGHGGMSVRPRFSA